MDGCVLGGSCLLFSGGHQPLWGSSSCTLSLSHMTKLLVLSLMIRWASLQKFCPLFYKYYCFVATHILWIWRGREDKRENWWTPTLWAENSYPTWTGFSNLLWRIAMNANYSRAIWRTSMKPAAHFTWKANNWSVHPFDCPWNSVQEIMNKVSEKQLPWDCFLIQCK